MTNLGLRKYSSPVKDVGVAPIIVWPKSNGPIDARGATMDVWTPISLSFTADTVADETISFDLLLLAPDDNAQDCFYWFVDSTPTAVNTTTGAGVKITDGEHEWIRNLPWNTRVLIKTEAGTGDECPCQIWTNE
jgi:hypothetical protein